MSPRPSGGRPGQRQTGALGCLCFLCPWSSSWWAKRGAQPLGAPAVLFPWGVLRTVRRHPPVPGCAEHRAGYLSPPHPQGQCTCPHPTPRGSGCRVETWSSQLQRRHPYPAGGSQVHSKQGTAPRPSPQQSATCASGEQAPHRRAFPLDLQHITAPGPWGPLTHPNWGSEGPPAGRAHSLGVRPHTLAGPHTDPSRTLVRTPPSLTPLVDVTAGQLVPFSPVVLPTKSVFVSVSVADLHLPTCTWLRPTAQLWHFPGSPALPGTEHWPLRSPAEVPGWMAEVVLELLLSPMGRD